MKRRAAFLVGLVALLLVVLARFSARVPEPAPSATTASPPATGEPSASPARPTLQPPEARTDQRQMEGRVFDQDTSRPLPQALVELVPEPLALDGPEQRLVLVSVQKAVSGPDGHFAMPCATGAYFLRASAQGYPALYSSAFVFGTDGDHGFHSVPLRASGELAVTARGTSGAVLSGVRLRLLVPFGTWNAVVTATTGQNGVASLVAPSGRGYQLTATHERLPGLSRRGVVVERGVRSALELEFPDGVPLHGSIVNREGKPLAGASVKTTPFTGRYRGESSTRSAADGTFQMVVLPGTQQLDVKLDGYAAYSQDVSPLDSPLRVVLDHGAALSGRVLDGQSGAPVGGARVTSDAGEVAVTDAAGAYSLVATVAGGKATLSAGAPGYRRLQVKVDDLEPGASRSGIDLPLSRAVHLRGIVLDSVTGAPIGSARVVLQQPSGPQFLRSMGPATQDDAGSIADAAGRFEIDVPASSAELVVQADGYADQRRGLELPLDRDTDDLEVRLDPGGSLEGRITDLQGHPVADADIRLRGETPQPRGAVSDQTGVYRIDSLEGRKSYMLAATRQGFAPAGIEGLWLEPGAQVKGIDLVLRPAGGISGKVVYEKTGEPVASAMVWAQRANERPWRQRLMALGVGSAYAATAVDGSYEIGPLPAGTYDLRVEDKNVVTNYDLDEMHRRGVEVREGAVTNDILIEVRRGVAIRGHILDSQNQPVSGTMVSAAALDTASSSTVISGGAQVELDGSYEISALDQGAYRVTAQRQDTLWTEGRDVEAPAEGVDFVVPAEAEIDGVVLRASDQRPVPEFEIRLTSAEPQLRVRGGPGASGLPFYTTDGSFELRGLTEGLYDLEVISPGFAARKLEGLRLAPGQVMKDVRIELTTGASIAGVVLDERGGPVSGASITRKAAGPGRSRVITFSGGPPRLETTAVTGADGQFYLGALPAGPTDLDITHRDFVPTALHVELQEGEQREGVEVRLRGGFRVRGVVVRAGERRPVAGATVAIDVPMQRLSRFSRGQLPTSGADGSFELVHVAEGQHTLLAKAPGSLVTGSKMLDVKADIPDVEIEIGGGGSVQGEVLDGDGKPVPSVEVWISGEPGFDYETTDEQGRFELEDLNPGAYTIEAEVPRHGSMVELSQPVAVEEGKVTRVTLQSPGAAAIQGQVRRSDGGSVERFMVMAGPEQEQGLNDGRSVAGQMRLPTSGAYRIPDLEPGRYRVSVYPPVEIAVRALARVEQQVELGEKDLTLDLVVPPGAGLAGQVSDSEGKAVPGATVHLSKVAEAGAAGNLAPWSGVDATTDQAGAYGFRELPSGRFDLSVEKQGFAGQTLTLELKDGEQAHRDVTLRQGNVLRGRVIDEAGRTISGATLVVRRPDGTAARTVPLVHDESGMYEVSGLADGEYFLTALAVGRAPATAPSLMRIGGDTPSRADFSPTRGGRLEILVRDATGAPLAAAEVQIERLTAGVPLDISGLGGWGTDRPARYATDATGKVVATRLEPGSYQIRTTGPKPSDATAELQEDAIGSVELRQAP